MKKFLIGLLALICVCVFTFTFTACDNGNDKNADPSTNEQQVWLPYTMLDHFENCKRTYYYDEYGNEIKVTKEDLNGNIQATWLSEYDDNQNLIKRSVDTGKGEPFVQLIQIYNDKGNLIEKREINLSGESVYTYQYNEQNRCISKSSGGQIVETYIYEADGSYKVQKANNANEYSLYRADGKIQVRYFGSNMKAEYSYNDESALVECTTYSGEDITQKQIYHFDDNGNLIKIIQTDASGHETVVGEYEHKLYTVKAK